MKSALVAALLATAGSALAADVAVSRSELIAEGETALSRLDAEAAERAFERAGSMAHEADAELGLVRTYMQAGEYRRALAFVAHTSGAHIDEPAGAALQSWLLYIGGQRQPAKRFLAEALARRPDDRILEEARHQLDSGSPVAQGILLHAPSRFAPYGRTPPRGRVSGTGWLFGDGRRALVPIEAMRGSSFAWVRNAKGELSRGVVTKRDSRSGVVELRLDTRFALSSAPTSAPRDPFAGAVGYAIEYTEGASEPAWPILRAGFFGAASLDFDDRPVGRSSVVFDAAGRFAGIALRKGKNEQVVTVSRLGLFLEAPTTSSPSAVMPADEIYERSLSNVIQVIAP